MPYQMRADNVPKVAQAGSPGWFLFRATASCIVRQTPVQYSLGVSSAMPQQASRSARIEARIAPDALRIVRRAAELQGRSISDFVVAAAQEVAHRTIDEAQAIHLSVEDQVRFVELLLNPPVLAPALKRAQKAPERLIASSR